MRHFSVFLLVFLSLIADLYSQSWKRYVIDPSLEKMNSVAMRGSASGIAVGNNGVIQKCTEIIEDAGLRSLLWSTANSTTTATLHDVVLLEDDGYVAVGTSGTVLLALSDGALPVQVAGINSIDFFAVARHNSTILIGGADGAVYYTTNLSSTWTPITTVTTDTIIDISVAGNGTWFIATKTTLYKSSDLKNWLPIPLDGNRTYHQLLSIRRPITGEWLLYRLGNPLMYSVSIDGGETWTELLSQFDELRTELPNSQALCMTVFPDGLRHSLMFTNNDLPHLSTFHLVTFDGCLEWIDQCKQFFQTFVGSSQSIADDSTIVCTGASRGMLTFNKRGLGIQQLWNAPESVPTSFIPLTSIVTDTGVLIAGKDRILEFSKDYSSSSIKLIVPDCNIIDMKQNQNSTLVLVDSTWTETIQNGIRSHASFSVFTSNTNDSIFQRTYNPLDTVASQSIAISSNTCTLFTYGSSIRFSSDAGITWQKRVFSDTGIYTRSAGATVDGSYTLIPCFHINEPSTLFGYRTTDAGLTWKRVSNLPSNSGRITYSPHGSFLFASRTRVDVNQYRLQIHSSIDGGNTWKLVHEELQNSSSALQPTFITSGSSLLLITPSHILTSSGMDENWTTVGDLPLLQDDYFTTGNWISDTLYTVFTSSGYAYTHTYSQLSTVSTPALSTDFCEIAYSNRLLTTDCEVVYALGTDLLGRNFHVPISAASADGSVLTLNNLPRGLYCISLRTSQGYTKHLFQLLL